MVYCGRLSLVADLLQGLFKEAYTLQKGLLELLDKMTLNSSTAEEEVVSDIVTSGCLSVCLSPISTHAPHVIKHSHCSILSMWSH